MTPKHTLGSSVTAIPILADSVRVLISGESTGRQITMAELGVEPGGGIPLHVHTREDETFFILEGSVRFGFQDQSFVANVGDSVFAPRDVPHSFMGMGESPSKMLVSITPGNLDEMFVRLSELGQGASPEKVSGICQEFGISFLSPA